MKLTLFNSMIILVLVIIVSAGITFFTYLKWSTFQTEGIPISLEVGDKWKFNLENETLDFGMIPRGAIGRRDITITGVDKKAIVQIHSTLLFVQPEINNFVLEPYEPRTIRIIAAVPSEYAEGKYTGILWIRLRRT